MPTLDFEGKSHIYAHHYTVPCAPLVPDPAKSVGEPSVDGNLVIHGDNLYGLKALLPRYHGRAKCVYIDPPYNTGNEGWSYNDNARGPVLQRWYRDNGPVDGDDPERHEKWLCMMWPRLQLLKELLRDDGVILVSIDDNELHHLRMLMDEIFGEENFIVKIIWKKRSTPPNDKIIGANHEYILAYSKDLASVNLNLRERTEEQNARYRNPDNHPRGPWVAGDLMANVKGGRYVESLRFSITNPHTGEEHWPGTSGNWRFSQEKIEDLLAKDEIWFGANQRGRPKLKRFLEDVKAGITYPSIWDFVPMNIEGSSEMERIFGDPTAFESPKPSGFIRECLRLATNSGDLVLDSFAGSGTTAQAVLELNREDDGDRKFILVECEDSADTVTAERVRRVIAGVPDAKDAALREGLGGSFTYCTLGAPISAEGMLRGEDGDLPPYESLAAWLLHTATGVSVGTGQLRAMNEEGHFYSDGEKDYYLLYEPDVEWLRSDDAVLTELRAMRIRDAARADGRRPIVFAAAKYMSQRDLTGDFGITFCQLPWEIHRRPDGDRWS